MLCHRSDCPKQIFPVGKHLRNGTDIALAFMAHNNVPEPTPGPDHQFDAETVPRSTLTGEFRDVAEAIDP